jgi:predicted nucleic acid-binding protein
MNYLVDSCVWIDYFKYKKNFQTISDLLVSNALFVNKIILAELLPSAQAYGEHEFIVCLSGIGAVPLSIDWDEITEIQYGCIKAGINKLGLLDIAIAQNAKQNGLGVFSSNRHMVLLCQKIGIGCRAS